MDFLVSGRTPHPALGLIYRVGLGSAVRCTWFGLRSLLAHTRGGTMRNANSPAAGSSPSTDGRGRA